MFKSSIVSKILFCIIIFVNFCCNEVYKAGNGIELLNIEIVSNINQNEAFKYLDSNANLEKYKLPEKYNSLLRNGGDIEYFPKSFFSGESLPGPVCWLAVLAVLRSVLLFTLAFFSCPPSFSLKN